MAVPFGISVLDVAKAIQLAREIYQKCFTEAQGASTSIPKDEKSQPQSLPGVLI